jgi:4-amino-4-deoxy-L-arabinose transferase-like glycosyltransferase
VEDLRRESVRAGCPAHRSWNGIRQVALILIAALALVATDLGARVLATNDEARFPLLAQDILSRGDWLHPMVNGSPYYNKPPLHAWLIAVASWPRGSVSQFTAAVPSALAALAAALLVWLIGRSLFGSDAGRAAALAFVTMQGVFLHARLSLPDMLLTALITASLWVFTIALRRTETFWWPAFYGLVGAAFWAKGPAGLLPLAVAIVVAVMRFRRQWWRRIALLQGLAIVVAVTSPWWLPHVAADRGAFGHAIVADQLRWYAPGVPTLASVLGPMQNVTGVLFPWVIVLPSVAAQALRLVRGRGAERDQVMFLLTWAIVTAVIVALSREQRLRYYLPVAPATALLIGWWYAGSVVKRRAEQYVNWPLATTVGGAVAALALAMSAGRPRWRADARLLVPGSAWEVAFLLTALGVMLTALGVGVRFKRLAGGFAVAWIGAALMLGGGYHWALARRNAAYDYPRISATTQPLLSGFPELRAWGTPALPVAFYFRRPVTPLGARQSFPALLPGRQPIAAVARASLLAQDHSTDLVVLGLERLGAETIAVVRQASPVTGGIDRLP